MAEAITTSKASISRKNRDLYEEKKRPELLHYEVILHCDSTRIHQQSQSCQMNMSSQCSNIVTILI